VALSIPILFLASQQAALYVFALAFGIGLGGDYMIIPLMAAELFGLQALGRVMGIVLTADGVAEAVTPMAVAALRDAAGSYRPGFMLLIVLAAVGALAVAALPRPDEKGVGRFLRSA
jgi:nitrate/nitrite transporter NarK